eukprot:TRINITY_DN27716_c0_g1_i1.p4 TRINITY_DN27716_c0_g1~~TRINITY_DN27716_c0_g1_i1.p4  ORF type:complete len:110 (-),score=37.85 TRINITY_DN27716_c0_g1_i1:87-416(-)
MIRRPPRSTHCISSAASDVYKRQYQRRVHGFGRTRGSVQIMITNAGKQPKQVIAVDPSKTMKGITSDVKSWNTLDSQKKKKVKSTDPVKLPAQFQSCLLYTSPSPRDQA